MKKYFLFLITFFLTFNSLACDICGCGAGNYYMGLMPGFSKSFIGMRYQFSRFHTNISGDATQFSNDFFETAELWGGVNIGSRWQVIGIIPFNFISQINDDGTLHSSGLGDIAVMANYKIFNKVSATARKKLVTQTLLVGAGIKMPTGKFRVDQTQADIAAVANTQAGSGSTDFILNANYIINFGRAGLTNTIQYKINTTNHDQYYFGNKISANSIAYYSFTKAKTTITPNAGLLFTQNQNNQSANIKLNTTSGYLLSSAAGVEVNFKSITIGGNVQLPLSQRFAGGQTNTELKGMVHITFSL